MTRPTPPSKVISAIPASAPSGLLLDKPSSLLGPSTDRPAAVLAPSSQMQERGWAGGRGPERCYGSIPGGRLLPPGPAASSKGLMSEHLTSLETLPRLGRAKHQDHLRKVLVMVTACAHTPSPTSRCPRPRADLGKEGPLASLEHARGQSWVLHAHRCP